MSGFRIRPSNKVLIVSGSIEQSNNNSLVNITDISENNDIAYNFALVDGSGNQPLYRDPLGLIYKNKKFGLNTPNPSQTLDVSGNVKIDGKLYAQNSHGVNNQILTSTGTGITWSSSINVQTLDISSAVISDLSSTNMDVSGNIRVLGSGYINDLSSTNIDVSGIIRVLGSGYINDLSSTNIDVSGNIRVLGSGYINDLSSTNIDVSGNIRVLGSGYIKDLSSNNIDVSGNIRVLGKGYINDLSSNNVDVSGNINVLGKGYIKDLSSNNMDISGNLSVDTNTLFVDASNNRVGVNTSSPSYPLQVNGNLKATGLVDAENQLGTNGQVLVSNGSQYIWNDNRVDVSNNESSVIIHYPTFCQNNTGSQRLNIDKTGLAFQPSTNNFGIGTNNPTSTLDVSGTANITGNLSVDTNTLFVDASNNRVGVGTIGPQATLSIGGATGQLNHYVYNTTTTSPFNNWFRVAQFANFTERTDINLSISTRAGGAIGLTKVNITSTGTIKADWRNGNNQYGLQGVRLATESGITYLEVLTNQIDVVGWTITTSYITGANFTPLEFTSTTGSVALKTFLFADYGSLNGGSFISTISSYNYNILTDGIERMRITSTGNVGIGTSTPETKLDVVGNSIQCSNQGRFKGWYSGGAGSGLATEIGTLSGEGYINTYDRTSGTYGPLNLVAGSSANIKLLTNGNVGIGTTTPAYPLDVNGSAKFTTIRDSANLPGTSGQVLSSTGSTLSWITPSVPSVSTGYAVLRETQNAGVNAGYTFSGSTLIKRRLNNVVSNGITISLTGTPNWNFNITEAGTYAFRGRACYSTAIPGAGYRDIFNSRIHIANETIPPGFENAITGDTEKTNSFNVTAGADTLNGRNIWGNIDGILTITANTVLSMKQYSYPTLYPQFNGANNAGIANNVAGTEEVYAVLTIQKLA
jgi:hypothetical protein